MALAQLLIEQNFPAIAIHRGMGQEERLSRYQQFKDFQKVNRPDCTDVLINVLYFHFPCFVWKIGFLVSCTARKSRLLNSLWMQEAVMFLSQICSET